MQLAAIMKTDNPQECTRIDKKSLLYSDFLNPLDETCRQFNTPRTADPLSPAATTPPPVASMPPRSPTKTPQPATTATITKTPSTSRPASVGAGGADSSQEAESTPTPSASSPTASDSPSPLASSSAFPPAESSSRTPVSSSTSSSASSAGSSSLSPPSFQSPDPTQSVSDYPATTESPDATLGNLSAASNAASSPTALIAGIVVGAVVVLAILSILFKRKLRRKAPHSTTKTSQLVPSTTVESVTASQEDMSEIYNQLVALDNWRIDASELVDGRLLGCGAKAAVYLVTLDGGRRLASKRLVRDQLTDQRLGSFILEIELAAKLKHPSIVQFVGVAWTTPSDFQALFEYMSNGDLRVYLDQTKPSQPQPWTSQKIHIALQISQAMVYIHSFDPPIVHRNIKARNILLDEDMNAKLSDFGVSRSVSEQATMTTGVGTSRWLAPEVIMGGGKYTEQCDIYSFGVLLTEIDSHDLPFAGEKLPEIELLHRVATGTLRPTLSLQCDPLLRELILQCLSVNPSDRPNALELSYRLRKILKSYETD